MSPLVLVDTSAWICFFARRGYPEIKSAISLLLEEDRAAIAGPILMELIQGARTMGFKNTSPFFPLKPSNHPVDFFSGEANQGLLIFPPVIPTPLLLQYPSTSRLDQSGRNQEQPLPNR